MSDVVFQDCPRCGSPKRQLLACTHCGYSYLEETRTGRRRSRRQPRSSAGNAAGRYDGRSGLTREQRRDRVFSPANHNTPQQPGNSGSTRRISDGPKLVELYDRRGQRVDAQKRCNGCGRHSRPVWRFWNTSIGMAYLCKECKIKALDRSKRTDALDHRLPGSF